MNLLLVEDVREAREALARALSRARYTVVGAATADEAVGLLGERFDCAVIDIVLAHADRGGLRVLEAFRAKNKQAPVVMVTAFADVGNVKAALNLGASHLLEKPFRAADLLALLDRLMTARPDTNAAITEAFARARLTPREAEIALLALKGLSSPEVAQVLTMSEKTVRQHLSKVYEKHGVSSRGELVALLFPI